MKKAAITIAILSMSLALLSISSCNMFGASDKNRQTSEVVRGDIEITVDGSGEIQASRQVKLSFGSTGKVDEVYVKEGDYVTAGALLAKLDIDELYLARTQAQVDLEKAKVALTESRVLFTKAKLSREATIYELGKLKDSKAKLELALLNAQIDVRSAEHHLDETRDMYTWPDIETAQKDVDNAKAFLQYALDQNLPEATITYAQARLDAAEAVLDAKRNAYDTEEVAIAKMQLEAVQMAEIQAQKDLDDLEKDIVIKELELEAADETFEKTMESIELAGQSVTLAEQSLGNAEKNIEEASIIAPFDGIVAAVGAKAGDTILTTTTMIYLIDPSSLELIIEIDEMDITEIKLGQKAIVGVDSLPNDTFTGTVTSIYPVPTSGTGIVSYNIRINFDDLIDNRLMIGMNASADIVIDERSNALLIPNEALETDSDGRHVTRVTVNEEVEERQVVIGISDGRQTEIISGLSEGEIVLTQ